MVSYPGGSFFGQYYPDTIELHVITRGKANPVATEPDYVIADLSAARKFVADVKPTKLTLS